MRSFLELVGVAARAAEVGAAYLRAVPPPDPTRWAEKGQFDFVTEVDRAVEARIVERLLADVPGSRVVGEELTPDAARDADVVWIVDPLDGTTNFLHGYRQYAVSIGCVVGGTLSVGVVHDVTRGDVYRGATGEGAWLGERRLAVSAVTDPARALVGTGFPFKYPEHLETYLRQFRAVIRASSGIRRAGSAALDLADLAAGRFDAFWELMLAPWDVAAGVVLVREAGGVVTTLAGDPDVLHRGSVVAGNPTLHPWLRRLLEGGDPFP
jgi:myo-inositol-1(or 4)-monophosphatase